MAQAQVAAGKTVSKPGDTVFKHETGVIKYNNKELRYFMTAVLWYDKNLVSLLSTRHDNTIIKYMMKKKGQKDAVETTQPLLRDYYNKNKVGVDVVDQRNASVSNDHGSKLTPWHRVHDFFANTAMTLAFEHYKIVINSMGTPEQKQDLKRKIHNADEARWQLIEELTRDAQFGELPGRLRGLQNEPSCSALVVTPAAHMLRPSHADIAASLSSKSSSKRSDCSSLCSRSSKSSKTTSSSIGFRIAPTLNRNQESVPV